MEDEFKKGIIMPTPVEPQIEMPIETPEHPNSAILENIMMSQHEKSSEANQLLEHILIKLDDNSDKTLDEHILLKTNETVEELKKLQEIIKDNNQWEVKLILE